MRDEVRLAHGNLPKEIVYQRKGEPISFDPKRFPTIIYEQDEPPQSLWTQKKSKPFNWELRTWTDFRLAFNALVNKILMSDSLEMIRDHMGPEIRKQVANLFFASAELFD
jgi:hypothetical protein